MADLKYYIDLGFTPAQAIKAQAQALQAQAQALRAQAQAQAQALAELKEKNRHEEEMKKSGLVGEEMKSIFEEVVAVKKKLEETDNKVQFVALETHSIKEAMPSVVVGINITPSEASGKKGIEFMKLLDCLNIDPPVATSEVYSDEGVYSNHNYDDWSWNSKSEADSYEPFCLHMNNIRLDGTRPFYCFVVSDGQLLVEKLLFDHDLITLRSLDANGNKCKLVYRGHVKGRTDLVVMLYQPKGYITRHMVRFVFEVKTAKDMREKFGSCVREACTQVIGMCADNANNSPSVILTDFTAKFYVCYLQVSPLSNPSQLKYDIIVQTCSNIKSAINLAFQKSASCVSRDFCRPTTPEERV